ncbi:MAG: Ig-like domain-containing protein [Ignavibacteriales bacterium]|nr:Ig-like domain-containing protein [Ignavibacteriales bacterium]
MARKQQVIFPILFAATILFVIGCANQLSPPGGEKDIIPPKILESFPENGTTNFDKDFIELTFSEYVTKRTVNDAFFISPILESTPEFSWTNKSVEITFKEKLKENTTYSIVIGTEITDVNNNNKMTEPFILTFSTGSKIDSGNISGKVYADKVDEIMIFAYKKNVDSLNIYKNKPDYVSQVNKTGEYKINGLGNGEYELFAVKDEFKNLVYDKGEDQIGFASGSVVIQDSANKVYDVNFFMTKEDTLPPNILSATMTDKNHIVVEFSEPIDSSKMSADNFSIVDSTQNKTFNVKNYFKGNVNKSEYVLCINDSLNDENNIYLSAHDIFDLNKNKILSQSINFTPSNKVDTNYIKITQLVTDLAKNTIDYHQPKFIINFSDGFDTKILNTALVILDPDSNSIKFNFEKINDASVKIIPLNDLKPKTNYKVQINFKNITDLVGNKVDTIVTNKLTTINNLDFSGASGKVVTKKKNTKAVLKNLENKKMQIQKDVSKDGIFNFERLNPAKYLLWFYSDADSNNKYSFGNFDSLKYSEEFYFYPDTLNLRARWPVGDIEINY